MSGGPDTNRGAKRARELRAELGLPDDGPVPCLLDLVERVLGLPVVVAGLGEGIAGWCWRMGDGAILWVNGTEFVPRQRFTLAHELGHVRCRHTGALPPDTPETLSWSHDPLEVQANAFAAELLMPAPAVRAMVAGEPSLEDAARVAARFGVSCLSAVHRFNRLELTTRHGRLVEEAKDGDTVGAIWERLGLPEAYEDGIGAVGKSLPRMSPALAGSGLAAVVEGRTTVADLAVAHGADGERLAELVAVLGGPCA